MVSRLSDRHRWLALAPFPPAAKRGVRVIRLAWDRRCRDSPAPPSTSAACPPRRDVRGLRPPRLGHAAAALLRRPAADLPAGCRRVDRDDAARPTADMPAVRARRAGGAKSAGPRQPQNGSGARPRRRWAGSCGSGLSARPDPPIIRPLLRGGCPICPHRSSTSAPPTAGFPTGSTSTAGRVDRRHTRARRAGSRALRRGRPDIWRSRGPGPGGAHPTRRRWRPDRSKDRNRCRRRRLMTRSTAARTTGTGVT